MNREEKSAYNRAYLQKHRDRIEARRIARRTNASGKERICMVRGCNAVHEALGYCNRHYAAFIRNGDALLVKQKQNHGLKPAERLALRTSKGDGCWEWTGARNWQGYGVLRTAGENLAHRVAYRLECGPIPAGMNVLHRCDNPACVRVSHLFLGTLADNNADMDAKGRRRSKPSVGSVNGKAKLTEAIVRAIRSSAAKGVELASMYGVSQTNISAIRNRRMWKHVT